jgi:hypothetical protein
MQVPQRRDALLERPGRAAGVRLCRHHDRRSGEYEGEDEGARQGEPRGDRQSGRGDGPSGPLHQPRADDAEQPA